MTSFTVLWFVYMGYDYFKKRKLYKNVTVSINPNLKLGSDITCFAGVVLVYSGALANIYFDFGNSGVFYLIAIGLLIYLFAVGLNLVWRKRNNLRPFQTKQKTAPT